MSANADLITVETYVHIKGKRLKTSFSYMGQNVKNIFFSYLRNFLSFRPHHRAVKSITRENITVSFSYMGPHVIFFKCLAIRGGEGAGWPINNQTGPIFPAILSPISIYI